MQSVLTYDYKIGHPLHATLLQLVQNVQVLALHLGLINRKLLDRIGEFITVWCGGWLLLLWRGPCMP
jgi:hypothetical protein